MNKGRTAVGLALGALALAQSMGCGIYGGGGGGSDKADVMGNISASTPVIAGRDIVVFVYRVKDDPADCRVPVLPDQDYEAKQTLEDGANTFELNKVKTGRLVIAFLLDNEGKDADGRIDPGDPVAVLNDPDCILDDVPNKYVVEALDVRINFGLEDVVGMPEPGRADAGTLEEMPQD